MLMLSRDFLSSQLARAPAVDQARRKETASPAMVIQFSFRPRHGQTASKTMEEDEASLC